MALFGVDRPDAATLHSAADEKCTGPGDRCSIAVEQTLVPRPVYNCDVNPRAAKR